MGRDEPLAATHPLACCEQGYRSMRHRGGARAFATDWTRVRVGRGQCLFGDRFEPRPLDPELGEAPGGAERCDEVVEAGCCAGGVECPAHDSVHVGCGGQVEVGDVCGERSAPPAELNLQPIDERLEGQRVALLVAERGPPPARPFQLGQFAPSASSSSRSRAENRIAPTVIAAGCSRMGTTTAAGNPRVEEHSPGVVVKLEPEPAWGVLDQQRHHVRMGRRRPGRTDVLVTNAGIDGGVNSRRRLGVGRAAESVKDEVA